MPSSFSGTSCKIAPGAFLPKMFVEVTTQFHVIAPKPYLLFANDFDIREVSLNGDDYKPILSIWSSIVALAVDTRDQMLYWADNFNKTISRAPIGNPGRVEVIHNNDLKIMQGLDVDWIGRKIYWTDSGKVLPVSC